jgi:hypothetical protein
MVPMNKSGNTIFESVTSLKEGLDGSNTLKIIHPGAFWATSFAWNAPNNQVVENLAKLNIKNLPKDLIGFWSSISDGAILYLDQKYGQWGYRIYSSTEIMDQQQQWKQLFVDNWESNFMAIGEIIDEAHPVVAVTNEYFKDAISCSLYEGNPLDPIRNWTKIASSFHEWLDRLITAQGAKYWDWK